MSNRIRLFILNDPYPLRICKALADEIGLNESIVLLQLEYLIGISTTDTTDGELWTRQSLSNLKDEHFPWWSVPTISRIIQNLSNGKKGQYDPLIKLGSFNRLGFDRTQWFALDRDGIAKLKSVKIDDAIFQNEKCNRAKRKMQSRKMKNAFAQNEKSIRAKCNDDTLDSLPRFPDPESDPEPLPLPDNAEPGDDHSVVVVGSDGVEWPLSEILETAGRSHIFQDDNQAKTFVAHWLYALTQQSIHAPALYAISRIDVNPDPRYLSIVEAGPGKIVNTFWGGGAEIDVLRKAGVADLLTRMVPEIAAPNPDPPVDLPDTDDTLPSPEPHQRIYRRNGMTMPPDRIWESAKGQLETETPKAVYDSWVRDLVLLDYNPDRCRFVVGAASDYAREWVEGRLMSTMIRLLTGISGHTADLEITTWASWEASE